MGQRWSTLRLASARVHAARLARRKLPVLVQYCQVVTRPFRIGAGALAAILLAATFALAFADLLVLSGGSASSVSYSHRDNVTAERVVSVRSVEAYAGDVVAIYPALDLPPAFVSVDFYITEGGEGLAFQQDQRPSHVYAERLQVVAPERVTIERARPPVGSLHPDRLDLVWIAHFDAGTTVPSDPAERQLFDRWVGALDLTNTPTVTDASAAAFARAATWLLPGLSLAALAAFVVWAWSGRGGIRLQPDVGPAEAGAQLALAGGNYLRLFRNVLLGFTPILLYAAWATLFVFWNESAAVGGPANWATSLKLAVATVILAGAAAWGVLTWRVHQALHRWRHWQSQNPLIA